MTSASAYCAAWHRQAARGCHSNWRCTSSAPGTTHAAHVPCRPANDALLPAMSCMRTMQVMSSSTTKAWSPMLRTRSAKAMAVQMATKRCTNELPGGGAMTVVCAMAPLRCSSAAVSLSWSSLHAGGHLKANPHAWPCSACGWLPSVAHAPCDKVKSSRGLWDERSAGMNAQQAARAGGVQALPVRGGCKDAAHARVALPQDGVQHRGGLARGGGSDHQ